MNILNVFFGSSIPLTLGDGIRRCVLGVFALADGAISPCSTNSEYCSAWGDFSVWGH